jgi:hypothetical protein
MNKAQFIFIAFAIAASVGFYNVIVSVLGLQAAEEQVDKAQKEYDIAVQEEAAAQAEYDNVVRYGCADPVVKPGMVMCP